MYMEWALLRLVLKYSVLVLAVCCYQEGLLSFTSKHCLQFAPVTLTSLCLPILNGLEGRLLKCGDCSMLQLESMVHLATINMHAWQYYQSHDQQPKMPDTHKSYMLFCPPSLYKSPFSGLLQWTNTTILTEMVHLLYLLKDLYIVLFYLFSLFLPYCLLQTF